MSELNSTSQQANSLTSIQSPLWLIFDHPKKQQQLNGSTLRGVFQIQDVSEIMTIIQESGLESQQGIIEYEWLLAPTRVGSVENNQLLKRKKKTFYQISNSSLQFFRDNKVKEIKLIVCARKFLQTTTTTTRQQQPTQISTTIRNQSQQPLLLTSSQEVVAAESSPTEEEFEETAEADLDGGKCDQFFSCCKNPCHLFSSSPHKHTIVFFFAGLAMGMIIDVLLAVLIIVLFNIRFSY